MPPLFFYYQDDPSVRQIGHEKLVGRDILVAVVAAVITPPDPASMILFAVPMLVLYLLGVVIAWVFAKRPD